MLYKDFDIIIHGPRITIGPLEEADNEAYSKALYGDLYDTYRKNFPNIKIEPKIRKTLDHTADDETHAVRIGTRFIGWITLQHGPEDRPDVGITLIASERGKGYGPEAIRIFGNRLHEAYGLKRIYARVDVENTRSRRCFEKLGAVLDGEGQDPGLVKLRTELWPDGSRPAPQMCFYHLELPF